MAKFAVERDPRVYLADFRPQPDAAKLAMGLDLGTSTGYCVTYFNPLQPIEVPKLRFQMGQLDLSVGDYDSRGMMGCRLRAFLRKAAPDLLFFERVRYTPPKIDKFNASAVMARAANAAELLGGLMMVVSEYAAETGTPLHPIPIQAIKKRATNKGNANKEAVITAANATFGVDLPVEDYESAGSDNVADAAFCLLLGLEDYGAGVPTELIGVGDES